MMNYISHLWSRFMNYADRLGPHEWFWILAAMLILGTFFLRGLGSRKRF
jgi:hypothetical protein